MEILRLSKSDRQLRGAIALQGSKSLSNRALIALALAGADPADWLTNLSASTDTSTLLRLLQNPSEVYDTGDAGTTFRFLAAYLALQPGVQILTGSARMQERPVGPLVEALHQLGIAIEYLGKPGYPPLRIPNFKTPTSGSALPILHIDASISSQFLSALLLIGPYLPGGLEIIPTGMLVSRPYLDMTLQLMRHFGAGVAWQPGGSIAVQPGRYRPRPLVIEADWSAASYWYALAAFSDAADLVLTGLSSESWQGDRVLAGMLAPFGVVSMFVPPNSSSAHLPQVILQTDQESDHARRQTRVWRHNHRVWRHLDFRDCPDLAQTIAVICAGLGLPAIFSGLETLAIKETDRCAALTAELAKVGVTFEPDGHEPGRYRLHGKAAWNTPPRFATYGDHRMALAFAPLALFGPIELENPGVVHKSYPAFWEHLRSVGFVAEIKTTP